MTAIGFYLVQSQSSMTVYCSYFRLQHTFKVWCLSQSRTGPDHRPTRSPLRPTLAKSSPNFPDTTVPHLLTQFKQICSTIPSTVTPAAHNDLWDNTLSLQPLPLNESHSRNDRQVAQSYTFIRCSF